MLKGRIVSGKIVSILLAATMMAGCILTGCGSAESGSLEAADKVAETANAPAAGNGEEGPGGTSGEPAEVSVIIETFDNTFASFVMNAMKNTRKSIRIKSTLHIWTPSRMPTRRSARWRIRFSTAPRPLSAWQWMPSSQNPL